MFLKAYFTHVPDSVGGCVQGVRLLARALKDGACPRLQELGLEKVCKGNSGLEALADVWGSGQAQCAYTIKRLEMGKHTHWSHLCVESNRSPLWGLTAGCSCGLIPTVPVCWLLVQANVVWGCVGCVRWCVPCCAGRAVSWSTWAWA